MRQIEANAARSRPLAYHDIEHTVLERRVEHLFHLAVQAMDFINEEHVALFKVRENRRQIARPGNSRTAGCADARAKLVGHDRCERRLAQTRGAAEQHVVHAFAALLRRLNKD